MSDTIRHVTIRGMVQGVGYRAWVDHEARARISRAGYATGVTAASRRCSPGLRRRGGDDRGVPRGPSSARVEAVQDEAGNADMLNLRRAGERFSVLPTI